MTGETGPILDGLTLRKTGLVGGFFGISVYNSLEIYISILRTFRRRRGLYFWSAICANTGIPLISIFVLLRYFNVGPAGPLAIILDIAWFMMVNGQSLMLYSRLHLASYSDGRSKKTALGVVDDLYVYALRTALKPMEIIKGPRVRKVLRELIGLFVLVVALDISLVVIQVTNHFDIQTTYKPVVYSIKLKVETFVLNHLVTLLVHPGCSCQQTGFQNDGRALTMTTSNDLTYGSWRCRYTSSAGVIDSAERHGISGCAGGGSVSTACTDESGRIKVPAKLSSL
ncbi:hypothetical protein CIB48_g8777 [Xylaria polymorpha]|nr:hypothetical protein CIB48_g8777 [Xylaria polymorpha]